MEVSYFYAGLESSEIEQFSVELVLRSIQCVESLETSDGIADNIMLNSVGASIQPCLTPSVTGNASEGLTASRTLAVISSWNW